MAEGASDKVLCPTCSGDIFEEIVLEVKEEKRRDTDSQGNEFHSCDGDEQEEDNWVDEEEKQPEAAYTQVSSSHHFQPEQPTTTYQSVIHQVDIIPISIPLLSSQQPNGPATTSVPSHPTTNQSPGNNLEQTIHVTAHTNAGVIGAPHPGV